ncbi:uncharacterized protein LOC110844681 [Folsomia candida]|uniref:uncharacterized protein LOC110844681 n=1 Tax=Folsomia candida TaxID=158441 RepID=UPI000B8F9475|nr:uncharacterized protein LOC110844681 [Folsomia candida]
MQVTGKRNPLVAGFSGLRFPEMIRTLTCDYYHRPSIACTSTDSEEPEMSEVMNTLRILSHPSRKSIQQSYTRCTNCNGAVIAQQRPRNRDDILRNLGKLERTLQARGEELPPWVQAYKEGNSVKAAKLLHLSFVSSRRSLKRAVVQEATSTRPNLEQNDVQTQLENDDEVNVISNKRIQLIS